MPGPEDRLKGALERLAAPADPSGAYERIVEKRVRRHFRRRAEIVGLVMVVLAGTVGGTFALAHVFRSGPVVHRPIAPSARNGKIAFLSNPFGGPTDHQAIFTANPDGTGIVAVTDPDYSETAALSPDGTRLVYIVRTNATSLEMISGNLDGTGKRTLARMTDILSHPAWSPDGTRIAFAPGPDFTIKTMPADGGTVIPLTRHSSHCGDDWPMWSSDGRRIAFLRACAPNPADVFVMNADGSNQMNLTGGSVKGVFGGSWSPDGTRIAFVVAVKPGEPAVRFGRFQISIISADGSGYRQLTRKGDNTSPTWSPDGKFIAFTSNRDGRYHVYTMMADGTHQSSLTPDPETEDFVLSWLPASVDLSAPSPAQNPSASPEPMPSPTPAWPLPKCATSWVNGDFDGDGQLDTASICRLKGGTFSLNVQWASGAAGAVSLPDCQSVCEARGAGDLNGDGKDEFFLVYSAGASTEFVEVFELPTSEIFGQHPAKIAPPGSPPGFPPGASAQFDLGGSVTHQGYLTCTTPQGGSREVVSTGTVLSTDQTTWQVHETRFSFSPGNEGLGQFAVVSVRDYTAPVDPNTPFVPPGDPCLDI